MICAGVISAEEARRKMRERNDGKEISSFIFDEVEDRITCAISNENYFCTIERCRLEEIPKTDIEYLEELGYTVREVPYYDKERYCEVDGMYSVEISWEED